MDLSGRMYFCSGSFVLNTWAISSRFMAVLPGAPCQGKEQVQGLLFNYSSKSTLTTLHYTRPKSLLFLSLFLPFLNLSFFFKQFFRVRSGMVVRGNHFCGIFYIPLTRMTINVPFFFLYVCNEVSKPFTTSSTLVLY